MKHIILSITLCCFMQLLSYAQTSEHKIDSLLPIRGLAIEVPSVDGLDLFLKFIEEELAPAHFNLLVLRVDWNYDYESHPELRDPNPLKKSDVKRIVSLCKKHGIRIVPQINLLGHQSWAETTHALLREYPEFDETPHVKTEKYTGWPNPDGLYCKSYCPLHPGVHKVVFSLIDELMDVFEADWFHAGMDEVFYIGDDKCPRCGGRDKAKLFADEVSKIQNHLASQGKRLMIWGDRLIDGQATGIGAWEASTNDTHRAIDLIPKEVFICDWHYERPDQTAVYFAMKGFDVATCPWRNPKIALTQMNDMIRFRESSTPEMAQRFQGIITTVWTGADSFLKNYYDPETYTKTVSDAVTLKTLIEAYKQMQQTVPAEKIDFQMSSIPQMLIFLRDLKNGQADKSQISDIFNHPDYDFEFRRYRIPSKEPLIDYFMQLNTIDESEIPTLTEREFMLRYNHKHWLAAYETPEHYQALYDRMKTLFTDETLENIYAQVRRGLPANTDLSNIQAISTMSIGTSFGYVFDDAVHFDIMGFDKYGIDLDALPSIIAHEIHHIAMDRWASTAIDSLTLEELFIFSFAQEGLAIKFCNNAEGIFSKALDSTRPVMSGSINYLNERFYETLEVFENTLEKIRSGEMNRDGLSKQFEDYWMNMRTEEQGPDEQPLLTQSRIYSFGNDFFGAIYDVYGVETLFDCVKHPLKAVEYFKQIVAGKK